MPQSCTTPSAEGLPYGEGHPTPLRTDFSPAARSWATSDQELFALTHGVLYCQDIITGYPVTIRTDHKNLLGITYEDTYPRRVRAADKVKFGKP